MRTARYLATQGNADPLLARALARLQAHGTQPVAGAQRRLALIEALCDPTVAVVDDGCADTELVDDLLFLADADLTLTMVITGRSVPERLREHPGLHHLELGPLEPGAATRLAAAMGVRDPVARAQLDGLYRTRPGAMVRWIREHPTGVPKVASEPDLGEDDAAFLWRAWLAGDELTGAHLVEIGKPETVQWAQTAGHLRVIGRDRFTVPAAGLRAAAAVLSERRRALLGQQATSSADTPTRRARAALYPGGEALHAALAQLLDGGRNEAVLWYTDLRMAAGDPEALWGVERGRALYACNRLVEAEEALEARLASLTPGSDLWSDAAYALGAVAFGLNHGDAYLARGEQWLASLPGLRADLRARIATCASAAGRVDLADRLLDEHTFGSDDEADARMHKLVADRAMMVGDFEGARTHYLSMRKVANPNLARFAAGVLGYVETMLGNTEAARETFAEAWRDTLTGGDLMSSASLASLHGSALRHDGDLEGARSMFRQAQHRFAQFGNSEQGVPLLNLAMIELEVQDTGVAEVEAEKAERIFEAAGRTAWARVARALRLIAAVGDEPRFAALAGGGGGPLTIRDAVARGLLVEASRRARELGFPDQAAVLDALIPPARSGLARPAGPPARRAATARSPHSLATGQ